MRIVDSIAMAFITGIEPGKPRQTGHTWVLGGAPKAVGQPQKILDSVPSSTWTSMPITGSNSATASA